MSLENSFGQRFSVRIISGDYNEFASVSRHAKSILLQWQSCYIMISCTDKKIFQKRGKGVLSRDKQLLKSIMKVKSCLNGLHVLKKVMEVLRKS